MSNWRVCTIGQTDIHVHPAMLVYLIYAWLTGHLPYMTAATLSILLHEAAHALVSALWGNPPKSVELTPLGAVMRLEDDVALPPIKRMQVILAGPAMTLLLCWAAVQGTQVNLLSPALGRVLFLSNLAILLLNLLPVPPLDGGRLLAILLSCCFSQRIVSRILRLLGNTLGVSLIALNIWCSWRLGGWNLSLAFAGCLLLYSAAAVSTTRAMAELRSFMDRKIRLEQQGSRSTTCISCLHTERVDRLVQRLPANRCTVFLCLEAGSMRMLGWIDEYALIQRYLQSPSARAGECLTCPQIGKGC